MKKIKIILIVLSIITLNQLSSAQTCQQNKVWVCRFDECGVEECKCVSASQAQSWMAIVPSCKPWNPHCCHGGTWKLSGQSSPAGLENAMDIYPNPASGAATISFSLEQSEHVSIKMYDITGSVVMILLDEVRATGGNEFTFNVAAITSGVYFLRMETGSFAEMKKIYVVN
jgi:hypothetical protein